MSPAKFYNKKEIPMKLLPWAAIAFVYSAIAGALATLAGWCTSAVFLLVLLIIVFVILTGSLCCMASRG